MPQTKQEDKFHRILSVVAGFVFEKIRINA